MSSFSLTVTNNAIKKLLSEKWQLAMFLIIPLMMAGLFSLISSGSGQPKPIGTLLITDKDQSMLSQLLINAFNQGPMAEMFISKKVDDKQADELMQSGQASVWLTIEKDFADRFLNQQPTTLKLVKNPSQNILPEIAQTTVGLIADAGHYAQQLFSQELKQINTMLNGKNISDAEMALLSVQIKNTIENVGKQLFPPQITAQKLKKESQQTNNNSFMKLMFPGILFMSLLFASQGMALDFWKDKTQGISRRLMATPSGLTQYLNGKLIASIAVYAVIALIIGLLGVALLDVSFNQLLLILLWVMLSGVALGSMMLLISLLMPSEKSASIITSAMVFPLMMLGGSFFPFDAMPPWMAAIGSYLPNGYLLHHFNQWFIHGQSLSTLLVPTIIAMLLIVILWLLNQSLLSQFVRK